MPPDKQRSPSEIGQDIKDALNLPSGDVSVASALQRLCDLKRMKVALEKQTGDDLTLPGGVVKRADIQRYYDQNKEAAWEEAFAALAAPSSTVKPVDGERDWVQCPVCGEPDMEQTQDSEGNKIINCVNHACASNGGDNYYALTGMVAPISMTPLSPEAAASRKPLPVEVMAGALQDKIEITQGRTRLVPSSIARPEGTETCALCEGTGWVRSAQPEAKAKDGAV